ncbi:MAG: NAD(P)/FAD-dependent oxidoreductase, partial [Flavobacteriales bacterium]
ELGYAKPLDSVLKGADMEHEVLTIGDYSYYSEQKYGKNYVMIGDAGAFLDPIFSSGIYVALETASRTARAVHTQLTKGEEAGQKVFEKEYVAINGGYELIEKFVRLFYSPELLNFAYVPQGDVVSYDKFLYAYNIFHYLLAGDFFDNHKKYMDLIDTIRNENQYQRFMHYIQTVRDEKDLQQECLYSFNDVYGHLPDEGRVVEVKG